MTFKYRDNKSILINNNDNTGREQSSSAKSIIPPFFNEDENNKENSTELCLTSSEYARFLVKKYEKKILKVKKRQFKNE